MEKNMIELKEEMAGRVESLSVEIAMLEDSLEKLQTKFQKLQQERNQLTTALVEKQGALKVLQELLKNGSKK